MDGENGRRLNTKANVPDNRGENLKPPSSTVNSERGNNHQEKNEISSAKTSYSSNNVPNFHAEAPCRSDKSNTNSPEYNKRHSDVVCDSFVLTESPAIQVMERPKSSDSGSTESPERFSIDSNDSLFSLTMGNDSFSKDHSLRISSVDMKGIGELSLSEAYLPHVVHRSNNNSTAAKVIDEAHKDVKKDANNLAVGGPNRNPPPEASISNHTDSNLSEGSDNQASKDENKSLNESSASPSTSASSCPMCGSLCCVKMEWCLRWPSWCCRLPSCSSCKWCAWQKYCNFCSRCPICCGFFSKCYGSCCYCNGNRETKRVRSVSSYA